MYLKSSASLNIINQKRERLGNHVVHGVVSVFLVHMGEDLQSSGFDTSVSLMQDGASWSNM